MYYCTTVSSVQDIALQLVQYLDIALWLELLLCAVSVQKGLFTSLFGHNKLSNHLAAGNKYTSKAQNKQGTRRAALGPGYIDYT